jgi:hypothetical protein
MRKFGKYFTCAIGAAAAVILAASLALAGEARMLTDEELDQVTGTNLNILAELPQILEKTIGQATELATGQIGSGAASGFTAVNVGNATNSNIVTQTNMVLLSGSGGVSIRQSNIANIGGSKK